MLLEVTDAGYYGKPPDCATNMLVVDSVV